jgi:N utilization substance protein B
VSEPKEGAGPTDPSRAKSDAAEAGGVSADAYGVTEDREGGRHRGREVALQVLYAIDLATDHEGPPRELQDQIFRRVADNFDVPRTAEKFARELVVGVIRQIEALDEILGLHARNWRVSRMAAVDRNVLRLAVFELRDSELPVAIVIDEAIDLARRFGSDASPSFVNGVLDAAAREVRAA